MDRDRMKLAFQEDESGSCMQGRLVGGERKRGVLVKKL